MLNISSGLARHAMDGSAAYCTTKAAVDMFSRCINAEPHDPARAKTKAVAVSLAPGIFDTDMQAYLRGQDATAFPEVARFRAMKDQGQLLPPAAVAKKIVAFLDGDAFGTDEIADLRNL